MPDLGEFDAVPDRSAAAQESAGWAAEGGAGAGRGTAITASATPFTKGSWTELIASTTKRAMGVVVCLMSGTAAVPYMVDIGIGAVGSESVIIPDLYYKQYTGAGSSINAVPILINIPIGSRISARCEADTASSVIYAAISLMEQE